MGLRRILVCSLVIGFAGTAWSAEVSNQVLYRIDVNSDPMDDGEVAQAGTTPGQTLSVVHPLGKGYAFGAADFGLLRAKAMLDPDFPTDQGSLAQTQTSFSDVLTISGSNNGSTASATFRLRATGSIRQPFYVSEVTGFATAYASLFAGTDLESGSSDGTYDAQGTEPIFFTYDDTLVVTVQFTVGQPVTLVGRLDASAEAQGLTVGPDVYNFEADFFNNATLERIELAGVSDPVVSAESGHDYPRTVSVMERDGSRASVALSQGRPNPFTEAIELRLTLPGTEHVSARVVDIAGREVRTMVDRILVAGVHPLRWDGRDQQLRAAEAGVYFLVVDTGSRHQTRKIVLAR